MESRPATMSMASRAGDTPLCSCLPEEIVVWEILVRLPPKSLLRCRVVCRAWRCATSTRDFLQAHHRRQPSLPIVYGSEYGFRARRKKILAFDHLAVGARLQPVTRFNENFSLEASCDGLLILSKPGGGGPRFSVSNPVTGQHAPLRQLSRFSLLGMYPHHSTGEYRLLLRRSFPDQIDCYVFALGSDQTPRYIGGLLAAPSAYLHNPALVRDSLHWYPLLYDDPQNYQTGSKEIIVFDTTSESFRQMLAPVVRAGSFIFEMDGTLGIYSYNDDMKIVDIWMLHDYGSEVWRYKYRVKLSAIEINEQFGGWMNDNWYVSVHSVDGNVLLMVNHGGWLFHVDTDGKVVERFRPDGQQVCATQLRLKQTLVSHTFFTMLEGYDAIRVK